MKIGDDQFENVLMLMNIQKMEKRDFFAEIRAQLDLDHYLNDIIIQFKEDQFSYGTILKNLTEEVRFDLFVGWHPADNLLSFI